MTEDALKPEVIKWAAFYEHRCKMGAKQIFHLEAFVAKYMRLYERCVMDFQKVMPILTTVAATPWASISIRHSRTFTRIPLSRGGKVVNVSSYQGVLALQSASRVRRLVVTS